MAVCLSVDSLSNPIDFGFKRSRVSGTVSALACVFSDWFPNPHDDEPLSSPISIVVVDLHLHRLHILVVFVCSSCVSQLKQLHSAITVAKTH